MKLFSKVQINALTAGETQGLDRGVGSLAAILRKGVSGRASVHWCGCQGLARRKGNNKSRTEDFM
jgi:hypothetical protein